VADRDDVAIHLGQVAGDGDLLDREGDCAIFDPVACSTARIVSGHRIHALAEKLRHQEPAIHPPEQPVEVFIAVAHDEIVIAAGIAGRHKSELSRRIAAEEIPAHHPIAYHVSWARRHTLVVERRGGLPARKMRFLADRYARREDLSPDAVEEKRRLA